MDPLAFVREVCTALPDVTERPSHGAPTWFRKRKTFVMFHDDHHGDGRVALWCAAPPGEQEALTSSDPEHYFVPPYVGHRGWVGVRLDRGLSDDEVREACEEAYRVVGPRR